MNHHLRPFAIAGLMLAASCNTDRVLDPSAAADPAESPAFGAGNFFGVTVLSRNLYIGADVDAVIAALVSPDPADDFPALLGAIGTLQETDFPTRVKALAAEIVRYRPHVVGLQEVTELDIDLTGFGIPVVISQDFLPALQAELASLGVNYSLAAMNTNTVATPLPGISVIDHDAILVDNSRVTLGATKVEQNFALNIGVVAPGVEIKRGWVTIEAIINGVSYTVANTHLESGNAPGLDQLRAGQAVELVASLGTARPAIMLGDFNDIPGSLMHRVVRGAEFRDVWASLNPTSTDGGRTCCHLPNLANERSTFDQRIDYVFSRGVGRRAEARRGRITVIGEERSDRIPGPAHLIWPSDHGGLVAEFRVRSDGSTDQF